MIVALVGFAINGDWLNVVLTALIFLLMLAPSFFKNRYKIYIPFDFDFAIVLFVFLTLFLGSLRNFYEKFPWWDSILHFQSGLLLGVIGFLLVYILNEQKSPKLVMSPGFVAFFAFCFSIALSGLWEIYEFFMDSVFGYSMQRNGLQDTMWDIIVNVVGTLIISILGYFWIKRNKKLPFTDLK